MCDFQRGGKEVLASLSPTLTRPPKESIDLGKLSLWGSEISLRREISVERASSITLATLIHHTVPPPIDRKSTFGNLEGEEYDDGCNGDTAGESGGKDIVVLCPKLGIPWSDRQLLT